MFTSVGSTMMIIVLGNTKSPQETLEKGIELAQKALAMDDSLAGAHGLLCALYIAKREYDKAIAEGERAVALNPGGTTALFNYATSLSLAGRPEEAIPLFQKAIRLNPFGPSYFIYANSATPSGMRGGLRRRFRHIRKQFSLRLITFLPILAWRLHTV